MPDVFERGQMVEIQPMLDGDWIKGRYVQELDLGIHMVTSALTAAIGLPIGRIRVCTKPCCAEGSN